MLSASIGSTPADAADWALGDGEQELGLLLFQPGIVNGTML